MSKFLRSPWLMMILALATPAIGFSLPTSADPISNSWTNSLPQSLSQSSKVAATSIIFVDSNGTNNNGAGTQAAPFRSITAALATNPLPGTIIQIAAGNYNAESGETFPIKIPNGVELKGNESGKGEGVIIKGGGSFFSATFARQNVAMVAGNNAQISGITLTNTNPRGYGLWLESSKNVAIANSTFIGSTHDGIFIAGDANPTITDNLFTQNKGSGISAVGMSSGEIRGNTFDNTGFGLSIAEKSRVLVTNNRIINNRDGIVITNVSTPTFRGNLIANNGSSGMVILKDRSGQPTPDLGTAESPGENIFEGNKKQDINNATAVTYVAVGNKIDPKKIAGALELVGTATAQGLTDIKGHWAEKYIMALSQKKIIGGFKDGTYRPDEPVTRAQFAAILSSAFPQKPVVRAIANFTDVSETFWGYKAIAEAQAKGFMSGYKNNLFLPAENIPRVQVLVALVNGWQLEGGNPEKLDQIYQDAAEIPSYALSAIAAATTNKLVINSEPKLLAPKRNATRAEVAAMIYQTLVNRGLAVVIPSSYIVKQ